MFFNKMLYIASFVIKSIGEGNSVENLKENNQIVVNYKGCIFCGNKNEAFELKGYKK